MIQKQTTSLALSILRLRGAIERRSSAIAEAKAAKPSNRKRFSIDLRRSDIELQLRVEECYAAIVSETTDSDDVWQPKKRGSIISVSKAIECLAKKRNTAEQIAKALGLSYGTVARRLSFLRRTGKVPRLTEKKIGRRLTRK